MSPTPDETYDAAVTAAVPALAAGLAVLFAAFAALHLVMLDGTPRVVMAVTAGAGALLLGAFAFLVAPPPAPRPAVACRHLGTGPAVAVGGAVLHLVLVDQPRQTTNVMLVIVGAGAVLLSLRWLAATLYLAWGAWGVGAFLVGTAPQWPHYVVGMCTATLLSLVVNHLRRANVRELATARTAAEAAAVRDHLTGLANRRGLAMVGGQMVEQARRQGDAVHCIFVDIDGLKRVNDALGHAVGDEVIVAVAEALRSGHPRHRRRRPVGRRRVLRRRARAPAWRRSSWSAGSATASCSPTTCRPRSGRSGSARAGRCSRRGTPAPSRRCSARPTRRCTCAGRCARRPAGSAAPQGRHPTVGGATARDGGPARVSGRRRAVSP